MAKKPPQTTVTRPVPGALGTLLNAGGLRAELTITREDGAPLSAEDLASVEATCGVWELREARVNELIERAAALLPANRTPSGTLRAAVAALGGMQEKPAHAPRTSRKGSR